MDEQPSPLQQIREKLALAVGENAVFDGWTDDCGRCGCRPGQVSTAPRLGLPMPKDQAGKIDLYIRAVDRELEAWFTPERLGKLKIREKIRALVWKRLEIMGPAREAVRRALAILAMPQNVPTGLKAGWRTADVMWRIAGRHQHRLQPLHQAADARRRLRFDPAGLARRPDRGLERDRRLPRPAHRRRHAVREVQGAVEGAGAFQREPVPRTAALPRALGRFPSGVVIDNQLQDERARSSRSRSRSTS